MPKKRTTKRRMGQCKYYRKTDGWCAKVDRKCRYRGRKSDCGLVGTKKRPVFVR
nr:hypothetical protein [Candidatus Freyarchaeota archaeon]